MDVEWGNQVNCGSGYAVRTICIQVSLFTIEFPRNGTWN